MQNLTQIVRAVFEIRDIYLHPRFAYLNMNKINFNNYGRFYWFPGRNRCARPPDYNHIYSS